MKIIFIIVFLVVFGVFGRMDFDDSVKSADDVCDVEGGTFISLTCIYSK